MSIVPRPRGGERLDDDIRAMKRAGVHLLVSMLTPDEQAATNLTAEAERCHAPGLEYLSVPIPDFGVPSDPVSFDDAVVQAVRTLSQNRSVAVDCCQSIGRSGVFTCAVLMAMGMALEKAVTIASEARGVPVPESPEQRRWLTTNAQRFANLRPVP